MEALRLFLTIPLIAFLAMPFLSIKWRGIVAYLAVILNAILSSYIAINVLGGENYQFIFSGNTVTGEIPVRIDALSAWFILIINFTILTGGLYGIYYMREYLTMRNSITLHVTAFILLHTALLSLCGLQNSIVFLLTWEIMALSAFMLVIFEHNKVSTIKAGVNFLIQSHVSIIFLLFGFVWVAAKTGSYDFLAISQFTHEYGNSVSLVLFIFLFIGFAIKAGFVPFHTWLPYAHPAAPAHISGIMSGVLIKIGIYGILRIILLQNSNLEVIGYIIITFSAISGIYGVMLAILQHNLKRLLAYHSIENIGIIGLGIGIGCVGLGTQNSVVASLGFAGALLHTLNHSLFKSQLFFTAGIVYQATHTVQIEKLGGLIKKMPQTAFLFLIAALAISGLPPFNGFISEFLIYSGLYNWLPNAASGILITVIFSILALVLIGGLALLCFTKAFGVVFLGNPRYHFKHQITEAPFGQILPLYFITALIVSIGLFPNAFLSVVSKPLNLFIALNQNYTSTNIGDNSEILRMISVSFASLFAFSALVFGIRRMVQHQQVISADETWGCGYTGETTKMQYTANSFARSYSKLFRFILLIFKKEKAVENVFPSHAEFESNPYDKVERVLIDKPIQSIRFFMSKFAFLQNGRLQYYIIYGVTFILAIIAIPLIFEKLLQLIEILKHL